jgi:UDP-2-acetamido-3-amino-2,3-dideoxy-glucuronate N-acetyltransferase
MTEQQTINVRSGTNVIHNVRAVGKLNYYNFVNLYDCSFGADCQVGAFVEVQSGVVVGDRCKISSHSFICSGVQIGDDVFIGHGVMFINDKYPVASVEGRLVRSEWTLVETRVEDAVSIGSNATILCGITLGRGARIGAGAIVTRDVKPGELVVGPAARPLQNSAS